MNAAQRRRRRARREAARRERLLSRCDGVLDFDANFSTRNLADAALKCRVGVGWKGEVQRWMLLNLVNAAKMSSQIRAGKYRKRRPRTFMLHDRGKVRRISPVTFRDRIVERVLCDRVLIPLLCPTLVEDNTASQTGKGTDYSRDRLTGHLQRHYRKHGTGGYALLFDFHNYFASIPSARAMDGIASLLRSLARDGREREDAERTVALTRTFVCEQDGLGLGNQTSQVVAVWWPSPIDHHFKEVLRVPYGRYMDDGYALFPDRESAVAAMADLRRMAGELGLTVNERKTRVVPVRGTRIPWLKATYELTETGAVRRRVASVALRRWKRHVRGVARLRDRGVVDNDVLEASLSSRNAIVKRCDSKTRRRLLKRLDGMTQGLLSGMARRN